MDYVALALQVAAVLLAILRLTDTARPLWNFLPPKVQPWVITLMGVGPIVVERLQTQVASALDLVNVAVFAVALFTASMRGAVPAEHYEKLEPEAKQAIARVRGRRGYSVPPASSAMFMLLSLSMIVLAPLTLTRCNKETAQVVGSVVGSVVEQVLLRAAQTNTVLDQVEAKLDLIGPLPGDYEKRARTALAASRAAIAAAVAAVEGGQKTVEVANQALAPFRDEWAKLIQILAEAGIADGAGRLKAAPGEIAIAEPLALKPVQ